MTKRQCHYNIGIVIININFLMNYKGTNRNQWWKETVARTQQWTGAQTSLESQPCIEHLGWERLAAIAGLNPKGHQWQWSTEWFPSAWHFASYFTDMTFLPRGSWMKGLSPACAAILESSRNFKKEGLAGESRPTAGCVLGRYFLFSPFSILTSASCFVRTWVFLATHSCYHNVMPDLGPRICRGENHVLRSLKW